MSVKRPFEIKIRARIELTPKEFYEFDKRVKQKKKFIVRSFTASHPGKNFVVDLNLELEW